MKPENCPRFEACSAPICPLDSQFIRRKMLKRERVCHYLREVSKQNWKIIATDAVDGFMYEFISTKLVELRAHSYELRQMLEEASKTNTYTKSNYCQ
jgi:hypothetical protein